MTRVALQVIGDERTERPRRGICRTMLAAETIEPWVVVRCTSRCRQLWAGGTAATESDLNEPSGQRKSSPLLFSGVTQKSRTVHCRDRLVSRPRSPRTKSCHRRQNVVVRLGPHEGPGRLIGDLQIGLDGRLRFAHTAMRTPSNRLFRESGKPAFHHVDPGSTGRREVHIRTGRLVVRFRITVTYFRKAAGARRLASSLARRACRSLREKVHLKRRCRPLVVELKGKEALLEIRQGSEVIRGEDLSLNDRKVNLNLIEPTRVGWSVDEDGVRPLGAETVGSFLTPMSGAVVHDPEAAPCGLVGLLAHDFADEAIHRRDAILELASTEDLGAMDVPSGQVDPGTPSKVFVFNPRWTIRGGRQSRLFRVSSLDTRLFVGGEDKFVSAQWGTLPNALVQIEDGTGFVGEIGITRKDPASMLPRTQGIAIEPAPQRSSADLCDEALRNHVLADLLNRKAG